MNLVYKKQLYPRGNGKWPDVITVYVKEGLPHVTFTRNVKEAELFEQGEAEYLGYILEMEVTRYE